MKTGIAVVLLLASCGTWVGNPRTGTGGQPGQPPSDQAGGSISANVVQSGDATVSQLTEAALLAAGDTGSSTAAQLLSLKYMIGSIMICEDAGSVGGAGFSNVSGCLEIYSGAPCPPGALQPGNECVPPLADVAAGKYAANQIDLMNPADRAKLAAPKPFGKDQVHKYNWAIMTWFPPIAVKGSVTVGAGVTINTKAGGTYSAPPGNGSGPFTTVGSDMTVGPPEETVVLSANGGAAFKFQTPFEITADDFANKTAFTIDLALNPAGVLAGSKSTIGGNIRSGDPTKLDSLYMPMLQLLPVPRRATEATKKEVYTVAAAPGRTLRIELYFNDGDPARSVYGAGALMLLDSAAVDGDIGVIDNFRVTGVSINADGTVKLDNSQFGVVVDGLKRQVSGTLTAVSSQARAASPMPPYTYVGDVKVP